MSVGGGGHERDVIIRVKVETDRARVAAELRGVGDAIKKAQDEAARGGKRLSDTVGKAATEQSAAIKKAYADVERTQARVVAMNERMGAQFIGIGRGALQAARGLALMGVAGEENTEKLLRGLVKIQGAFDIISGGVTTLTQINRLWRAYVVTVNAAATAHGALAAAQAVSAGTGVAAAAVTGAGVASAVGTGVTGVGLGALILGAGAAATALAAVAAAGYSVVASIDDARKYGVGGGGTPGGYNEYMGNWWWEQYKQREAGLPESHAVEEGTYLAYARTQRKQEERWAKQGRTYAEIDRMAVVAQGQSARGIAESQYRYGGRQYFDIEDRVRAAQEQVTRARGLRRDVAGMGERQHTEQTKGLVADYELQSMNELIRLQQQMQREKAAGARATIQAAKQELSIVEQTARVHEERARAIRGQEASAFRRYLSLDPSGRARVDRAAAAVTAGTATTQQALLVESYAMIGGKLAQDVEVILRRSMGGQMWAGGRTGKEYAGGMQEMNPMIKVAQETAALLRSKIANQEQAAKEETGKMVDQLDIYLKAYSDAREKEWVRRLDPTKAEQKAREDSAMSAMQKGWAQRRAVLGE